MKNKIVYKKIDSLERFLADFWKIFPNLTVDNFQNEVIEPYLLRSVEFCDLLTKNKIYLGNPIARGSFGTISNLSIYEDQNPPENAENIKAILVSKTREGKFMPFYLPVIIKKSTHTTKINKSEWKLIKNPSTNGLLLGVPDPISEIVFSSMVGFLYDSGVCPGFLKYFGSYACKNGTDYDISIVTEKSSFTLLELLTRTPSGNPKIDPFTLVNILFQYIYTMFVGKYFLGLTHYDTHRGNIMLSYINKDTYNFPNYDIIPYIYQGVDISSKKYIRFKHPLLSADGKTKYIAIQNTGLLLKLIDYGICSASLKDSKENCINKYNIEIATSTNLDIGVKDSTGKLVKDTSIFDAINHTMKDKSIQNTLDIQYLFNNIYENISNGTDINRPYPPEFIDIFNQFTGIFFDNNEKSPARTDNYINKIKPTSKIQYSTRYRVWDTISRDHNVGFTEKQLPNFRDPIELLNGLIRVCEQLKNPDGSSHIYNNNTDNSITYYLEHNIAKDINNENSLTLDVKSLSDNSSFKFIKTFCENEVQCRVNRVDESCEQIEKNDPNTLLEKPLLSRTKELFTNGKLDKNKINSNLDNYLRDGNDALKIYSIQINPSGVISSKTGADSFVYRSYQQWLNYLNIRNEKEGKYIETVNVNIAKLGPEIIKNASINKQINNNPIDLWKQSTNLKNNSTMLIVNGGYFITGNNINQEHAQNGLLRQAIDPNLLVFKPIGFYYNIDDIENSGTIVPVPKPYRKYFGVITKIGNGIKLGDYNDFIKEFQTEDKPILYKLEDGNFYATTQEVIKVLKSDGNIGIYGGKPVIKNNKPIDDSLKFAFCSGPILVKDGNIVFDLDTMLNTEFAIVDDDVPYVIQPNNVNIKPPNLTSYKIVFNALNDNMFKAGEIDGNQMYGMRHSARFMVHNVICENNKGEILFIMVEGRGYDAPGLDRVQLASLIEKFDIKTAISLDGGFSANAIYKINNGKRKFLMNDPEKRNLGVIMSFVLN
jgi:hypothetical protein